MLRRRSLTAATVVCLWLAAASLALAQPAPPLDRPLRVFFDCRGPGCDGDFFRTAITWVDHVRDQGDADVHVLVTTQGTGSGGTEYTIQFLGLQRFKGRDDSRRLATEPNETEDGRRRALARAFGLGLARYAAETPVGAVLEVAPPEGATTPTQTAAIQDPWNYWVFRINGNGSFDGEASNTFAGVNVNVSANRTTEAWKFNFGSGVNYNESTFELSDGEQFTSIRKGYNASSLLVKSLTDHWSLGGRAGLTRSTYFNLRRAIRVAPGIEYNFFPYRDSTERQFTIQWTAGVNKFRYYEETIYGKLEETRWDEVVIGLLSLRQPFGTIRITTEFAHYFHDLSRHRFIISADNEVRLTRGLSFNVDGNYSLLHDQLYLSRGEASDEEILVRQRQLETSYRYFLFVGITYRFGSINNNIVNPRFGGPGGGFF